MVPLYIRKRQTLFGKKKWIIFPCLKNNTGDFSQTVYVIV